MALPTLDLVQHLSGDKTATHYPDISGFGRDGKFVSSPAMSLTTGQYIQCPHDLTSVSINESDPAGPFLSVDEINNRIVALSNVDVVRVLLTDGTELFAGYCDSFVPDRVNQNHSTHNGSFATQDDFHFLETYGYSVFDNGDRVVLNSNNSPVNYTGRVSEKTQLPISNRFIGGCNLDFTDGNPSQTWVTDVLSGASYTVPVGAEFGFLHRTDKRNPHFFRWNDSFSNNDFVLYETTQAGQDLTDIEEWLGNGSVSLFCSVDGDDNNTGSFISPMEKIKSAHDVISDGDNINVLYNQKPRNLSGELTFTFDSNVISTSVDLTTEISIGDLFKNVNSLWYYVGGVTATEITLYTGAYGPVKYLDDSFTGSAIAITPDTSVLWSSIAYTAYTKNAISYNGSVNRSGSVDNNGLTFFQNGENNNLTGAGVSFRNFIFSRTSVEVNSSSSVVENISLVGRSDFLPSLIFIGDNMTVKNLIINSARMLINGNDISIDYVHLFNYNLAGYDATGDLFGNRYNIKRLRLRHVSETVNNVAINYLGDNSTTLYYPIIDDSVSLMKDDGNGNSFVKIQPVVNNAPLIPVYLDNMPSLFVDGRYVTGYKSNLNNSVFSSEKSITTAISYTPIQGRNEIQIVAKFDDGYWQPEDDPTTIVIHAYSELVRAYLGVLINLLPQGEMWKVRDTRVLAGLLTAFAVEYEAFDKSVNANLFNLFAHKTVEYMSEWEKDMGIPGDCRILEPTLERRRNTVLSKFRRFGGNTASVDYLVNLLAEFGYNVSIVEYPDTVDFATKGVFDFEIWSDYAGTETIPLKFGDVFGKQFSEIGSGIMDCIVNKFKPLGTTVTFKVNP